MGTAASGLARAERGQFESRSAASTRWTGRPRHAVLLVLVGACLAASLGGASSPAAGAATAARTVAVSYVSRAALTRALRVAPARLVHVVAPLRVAEVRPEGPASAYARLVRRLPGITGARQTVARAAAADPALVQGQVSTPGGGAYEWQYFVTGVDRVPAEVQAAAGSITIAIVDTGADAGSPALAGKIAGRYDVRTGRRAAGDASGHGTFVASLAAGTSLASGGVAGFGGAARLLVVKVSDSTTFDDLDVAAGIVYAVRHGARIVNLSVAGRSPSPVERSALAYAARRGVLVVAAVGNDALDGNPPEYPAAYLQPLGSNGVGGTGLAVAASDMAGQRAAFSESGTFVSLAAPGATVFGMLPARTTSALFSRQTLAGTSGGSYAYASGTSFAAPEVAGAAALVWAAEPTLTAPEVAAILKETASGGGTWTPELGFGVIDVAAAVARATAEAAAS